jgi:hypothetical protein
MTTTSDATYTTAGRDDAVTLHIPPVILRPTQRPLKPPVCPACAPQGDIANEAVAGGAAGLAYMRVLEGGDIDAAKPVKEGLSPEQVGRINR